MQLLPHTEEGWRAYTALVTAWNEAKLPRGVSFEGLLLELIRAIRKEPEIVLDSMDASDVGYL